MARASGIVLTLCVISLFFADQLDLVHVPLLGQVELKTYDMRLRALPSAPPQFVTIAAIDEQSLAKLGRWPWSRTTFTALAERLDQLGARVIAFDLFFPERESARVDAQFARAISSTKKVVLGTVFIDRQAEMRHLGPAGLAAARLAIAPQAIAEVQAETFRMDEPYGVLVNIVELQGAATYVGHIDVPPDADGVVRRAPLIRRFDRRYFPAFDVQVARAFLQKEVPTLDIAAYGIAGIRLGERYIPLDEEGRLLVRHRKPGSFAKVSIADILEQRADPALVRGRVVLVGNTAVGIGDARVTPYGATLPGVEIRASIIESLLQGDALQRPEWMMVLDIAFMAAAALLLIILLPRLGVTGGGVLAAGVLAGYVALALYLFRSEGLWLNLVYPTLLIALLFATETLVEYFFTFSEKRYLKRAFAHYVPPTVVDDLVADTDKLRLGGEKRELTVLFSDIRGFTTLSEAMAPEDLVKLMNEYFTVMTEKVFQQRGSLDKYIGDAIMALFGAPVAEPRHAACACRAAIEMVRALQPLRESWRARGIPSIDIGVGINTGPMVVGNMGSASRFNYTVVGDAVNLASRIEHLNKEYGTSILLSEYTYEPVKDEFRAAREVDMVRVRGRAQPVRLYELFADDHAFAWLDDYRAAYAVMREGDMLRAAGLFSALHARTGDGVSAFHALNCTTPRRRRVDETMA
ncbi:MAG TPA: adenylate/guanylate cyclase domain-containing protein [Burkholderiales bacterium]|nr:adenylate/guanylate cyclase domain-containing protein [Burkholderiales bacterium]